MRPARPGACRITYPRNHRSIRDRRPRRRHGGKGRPPPWRRSLTSGSAARGARARQGPRREDVVNFTFDKTNIEATSGKPGSADLILLDAAGAEIDRATVTVKATTRLGLDQGWGVAAGPTILAESSQFLHVTTFNGDETLAGTGAVKWTLSGTLEPAIGIVIGDATSFTGKPGTGEVKADCIDAHLTVPVTVVDAKDLTAVELSPTTLSIAKGQSGKLTATAKAGETAVYGAACTWTSTPAGLNTPSQETTPSLSTAPATTYGFTGKPGSYTATCALPGGKPAKASVSVSITIAN